MFGAVAVLFIGVSTKAGTRALGVLTIFGALRGYGRGRISFGWEGRSPSGYLTGWCAKRLCLFYTRAGVVAAVWPEVVMGLLGVGLQLIEVSHQLGPKSTSIGPPQTQALPPHAPSLPRLESPHTATRGGDSK